MSLIKEEVESSSLSEETQKQNEQWRNELKELEKEIQSLKSVLHVKSEEAAVLKKKLGISPLTDIKEDVKNSFQMLSETEVVQKTNAAFKNIGDKANKAFEDVRQSQTVRAIEEKVESAYSSLKHRLSTAGIISEGVADGKKEGGPIDKASEALYPDISKENVEELNEEFTNVYEKK